MIYLKDVIFEHKNHTTARAVRRDTVPIFRSAEGKVYALEPETFAADSLDFAARLDDRKRDTCKLARLIETPAMESRHAAYEGLLAKVRDPFGCRPVHGGTQPASWPAGESGAIARIPRRRTLLGKIWRQMVR